ncbi:O-methyltransferase [Halobium salinum]|uniref:O-methyltransferase n=1 Tax=Halobium salinum TaxID=1364940 RepID=A0ABD5P6R4_9EURY|nr:O-methyltransferase [Halobium salinum]
MDIVPEATRRYLRAVGPDHDAIQTEMADYAAENGFPIIGPESGAVLRLLARLTAAESVFEFGSGYGYSAYWFLRGMDGGHVVLTEFDADELDMAREFFGRAGLTERATFEGGDAVDIVDEYDGPFDVVLVDHEKERYAEAFEKVRGKVAPGGVVVADNLMRGPIAFDALLAYLEGDDGTSVDDALDGENAETRGIAEYLDTVRAAQGFETVALPVGSGLAVTTRL